MGTTQKTLPTTYDLPPRYRLEFHAERLAVLAQYIQWSLTEMDVFLFANLFGERFALERQTKYTAHYLRNLYSTRIYRFLSLLSGGEVSGRVEACTVALQWGIFLVIPAARS